MNRVATAAACFAAVALLCFLGPYLDDLDARQATADMVADRQAELVALRQEREVPRRKSAYNGDGK